ncbi:MAG: septum formation initiator family protein [Methylococcales bacterium]|nr:septum formation initiator family protein [Methylococcales bacterium]MCK5924347.1 septum formation initiator family protein [Methylococcales bacterium]
MGANVLFYNDGCALFYYQETIIKLFLVIIIVTFIFLLQMRLWTGDGSITQVHEYQQKLEVLNKQYIENKERNDILYGEVLNLRNGTEALEERARHELGMIKKNETFFQIIE